MIFQGMSQDHGHVFFDLADVVIVAVEPMTKNSATVHLCRNGQVIGIKLGGADCVERLTTCLREPDRADELRLLADEKSNGRLVTS